MAAAETKANDRLTAIVFAVFAVACIGAFLSYRGSDVGQLPKLVGNLSGGPLTGNGTVSMLLGLLVAYCIIISWAGLGEAILWILPNLGEVDRSLILSIRIAVGAATWSLAWFLLGLVGLYNGSTALICLAVGLITFVGFKAWRAQVTKKAADLSLVLLGLVAIALLLTLFSAIAPPIAKDALLYHFALPKAFVAQHSNAFVDGNIASYLALGTEVHYVWAMLAGNVFSARAGEVAAAASGFFFFPVLLTAITRWASELNISRTWCVIATAIVATVPTAFHVASSGYIDLALALYVTLATYCLARWWKEQTWSWVVLIAIFLGAALAVKLTTVFVIAAFALIILLRARRSKDTEAGGLRSGRIVVTGFAALLLAGVIASPWYIRTWVATGSPVFPFYMSIWPGKANGWDVERSNLFQAMNSQYGGVAESKLNLATAPVRASIMAQPEQAEYFDGVLGVAFLIGLPILIWALWKFDLAVEVKIAAGVAGIMYLFWLFSSEQLRYLLPILPLLAIAIAASAEAVTRTRKSLGKVLQYSLVAACLCGIVTSFAWFCQKAPLRVVFGGETRDQYLARNLEYYPYYQSINSETPPHERVWLINMRRDTYNIERPVFSDYLFEDWTLRKLVWESRNVQELRAKAAAMNVHYVLARHDFLFDYDHSTLVDDHEPAVVNEAKLKMAKDFLLDPERTVIADNKFSLTKVF